MMVPSMASFRSVSVCRTAVITLCIRSISCLKKIFMGDSAPIFCNLAFTWNEKKKNDNFKPLYSNTSLYARKSLMKRGPLFLCDWQRTEDSDTQWNVNNLIRSVYLMCDVVFRKLIEHVISQPLYNRLAGFSSAPRAILWLNAKDCIQARLGQVTLVSANTREILVSVFSTALFMFFSAECIVNVAKIYHAKVQSSFLQLLP